MTPLSSGANASVAASSICASETEYEGFSLANFAANGGVSGCGLPKPIQPLKIILGKYDRIIPKKEKEETKRTYNSNIEIANNSGHLPHLEEPQLVAKAWESLRNK